MTTFLSWVSLFAILSLDKVSTEINPEYTHFADFFSKDLAIELPKNIDINEDEIELIEGKKTSL